PYEPGGPDRTDLAILDALQGDLPLVSRPWAVIAERVGLPEDEVVARMPRRQSLGVPRSGSPVHASRRLGLAAATLVALRVPEDRVREVAEVVSTYPEVSHNFRRDHAYSLWFTLSAPTEERLSAVLAEILSRTGIPKEDTLN